MKPALKRILIPTSPCQGWSGSTPPLNCIPPSNINGGGLIITGLYPPDPTLQCPIHHLQLTGRIMILGLISNERVSFHIICAPSRVNCRWGCIPHRSVGSLIVHITPQNTHPPQKLHSSVKHQWRYRPSPSDQLMLAQTLFSGLHTTQ